MSNTVVINADDPNNLNPATPAPDATPAQEPTPAPAPAPEPTPAPAQEPAPAEPTKQEENAPEALDMASLEKEFLEAGELSEDTYKALEAKGLPKDVVDQYIEGKKAQASAEEARLMEIVGGADSYTEMIEWASGNLSAEEIASYDRAVTSGDKSIMELAITGLKAKHQASTSNAPAQQLNNGQAPQNTTGYATQAEMLADMQKPEYNTDVAFRNEVQAKLQATKLP